jgi:hypothetical protein
MARGGVNLLTAVPFASSARRRRHRAGLLGVLVAGCLVTGCGSSHMNLASPTTVPASSTTSTTVSATADDGQEPAILAAYRGSLEDFNAVEDTAPVNPNSPRLGDHMAGEQLTSVVKALDGLKQSGQVARGSVVSLHASVSQYNGAQAVVVSCERDGTSVVNARSGKSVTPATNSTELIDALVGRSGNTWKVSKSSRVSAGCR